MLKRPELLAPVGRLESFYAAIENGANAVYVGGKQFSARQFADNLDLLQLKKIVEYAKLRNIKVYVTLNTLVKNEEMDTFVSYVHDLSNIGVDALIIQDFGVARVVKKYFPNMPLHASTQMSAHSKYDVKFLENCGFKRVVLARELSLGEIEDIKKTINIEMETFVHGALCVSYSGQCLMSSIIGGRSGNRGRCAQPCRLPYTLTKDDIAITDNDSAYLMSPRDIQTLDLIPRLIDIGIDTFKIEGRMKAPEYVASVAGIYRKYIDLALEEKDYKITQDDKDELLTVFNRGGFTQGYFTNKSGKSMMSTDSPKNTGLLIGEVIFYNNTGNVLIKTTRNLNPGDGIGIWTQDKNHVGVGISKKIQAGDTFTVVIRGNIAIGDAVYLSKDHQLLNELTKSYKKNTRKSLITVNLKARLGKPIQLDLGHENGIKVSVTSDVVATAKNAPISSEKLYSQISKFGNTPFKATSVMVENDDNIYVSISRLNELRREATEALVEKILNMNPYDGQGYIRYLGDKNPNYGPCEDKTLSASVRTVEQLEACLGVVTHIYWELEYQTITDIEQAIELCHKNDSKLYISLPYIQREQDYKAYDDIMKLLETTNIDGYLIRTYGQYEKLLKSKKEKIIDYTLNVINNESIRHWESYGIDAITLSAEMSADEIQEMNGKCLEMVVYGHIPIMTSEQCLIGRYGNCPKEANAPDGTYKLTDRKSEDYPIITNCKVCRMQLLSSKPIVLANKIKRIQKLPIHKMRLIFTIENADQVKDVISWYTDETIQYKVEHTSGYFIKGVE